MISGLMIIVVVLALITASGFFMLSELEEKYKNMEDEENE